MSWTIPERSGDDPGPLLRSVRICGLREVGVLARTVGVRAGGEEFYRSVVRTRPTGPV